MIHARAVTHHTIIITIIININITRTTTSTRRGLGRKRQREVNTSNSSSMRPLPPNRAALSRHRLSGVPSRSADTTRQTMPTLRRRVSRQPN